MIQTTLFDSINRISKNQWEGTEIRDFYRDADSLMKSVIKKINIKDSFQFYYYEPGATLQCYAQSEKTNTQYSFGYYPPKNEIFFHTYIHNWENIRNIKDSFWIEFINVMDKYNFKFNPDSGPFYDKDITPEFNSNYKSNVFNIMSTYITAMLHSKEDRGNIGFGILEAIWTPQKDIDTIITEMVIAFKLFYRLNYLLWKSESIRDQNRINKRKKTS